MRRNRDREEAADEGEGRTNERNEICAGTSLMATHAYSIEEPREPSRKGDISATMGHTRTRRALIIIIIYFRREGTTYILSIVRTKETKQ